MKSGSRMISRRFIENTDLFNDGQNSEYQSPTRVGSDLRSGRVIEKIFELRWSRVGSQKITPCRTLVSIGYGQTSSLTENEHAH